MRYLESTADTLIYVQAHSKGASAVGCAFDGDAAAVDLADVLYYCKTQTRSSELSTAAFIDDIKALEYSGQVFFFDTAAVIFYDYG